MKRLYLYLYLCLFLLLCPAPTLRSGVYNKTFVTNFTKEMYRAGNKNWSIGEDELGRMYFGNDIGLLCFDGVEWELNAVERHNLIRSVAAVSSNKIFTGGYEEFGYWESHPSGKWQYNSLSKEVDRKLFKNDDFWKIRIAPDGVYFQSFNGIFLYNYKEVKKLPTGNKTFLFLNQVREEFIVQEMRGALYRLQGDRLTYIEHSDIFRDTDVRVILPYGQRSYLIGTAMNGLFLYDGDTFRKWDKDISRIMQTKELNSGLLAKDGYYYLGTILDGIYVIAPSGEIVDHLNAENLLPDNTVLALFEDAAQNIWAGLDRGISCIQRLGNMSYFAGSRGSASAIYDAALWQGKLFLGSNQGVFHIPESNLRKSEGLCNMQLIPGTQGQVWAFKVIDGRLYCNHNRGLKEIGPDLSVRDVISSIGTTHMASYKVDDSPVRVVSSYSGLRIIEPETETITIPQQINEPLSKTEMDHLGNLWIEHANKGIYRCKLNTGRDSLKKIKMYDAQGDNLSLKLKIFKVGGRIVLLRKGLFYTYDDVMDRIVPDQVLNTCFKNIQDIKQVIPIKENLYWALNTSSVFKFSYNGYQASIREAYNISANNLSLIHAYENISILNDSLNLICLDNGFLLYNSHQALSTYSKQIAEPQITGIIFSSLSGKSRFYESNSETPSIPYSCNNAEFRFSGKQLFARNLLIQYKLEGIDKDWSIPEKKNQAQYARLPQGNYRFLLRSVDNLGNRSEELAYSFRIRPPWFLSPGMYLLYVLAAFCIVTIIWITVKRRYGRLIRKREKELESKRLKMQNERLQLEVERKNSELMTQASFLIQKNELIFKLKNTIEDFYQNNKSVRMTEFYRKFNLLLQHNLNTDEDWKLFLIKFEAKHTNFFKKMKESYPNLSNNDLRLCACLRLDMGSKDIASLMNISVRAVENSRYRLRKKLNLEAQQNLTDFIINLH